MGSMEGARTVLDGPEPIPMHVWSPASSAYRDTFEREWRAKRGKSPILKAENLVLTPLVFVMWESRHEAFIKKYSKIRFRTVAGAMQEPGGWGTIAGHPDWGRFKFGHTDPEHSNSGLLTLVLMANEFFDKEYNLSHEDIARPAFQDWLRRFEPGVVRPGGAMTHSTGSLMREMVNRGPSQYDCVLVYENLAVGYLDAARDRWGQLVIDYPEPNMWNEHPYYILDVPWSDCAAAGGGRRIPPVPDERADPAPVRSSTGSGRATRRSRCGSRIARWSASPAGACGSTCRGCASRRPARSSATCSKPPAGPKGHRRSRRVSPATGRFPTLVS